MRPSRRQVVLALGAGALAAPFGSFAQQQGKIWRVGFLGTRPVPPSRDADALYLSFREGMRELGYLDGKNLVLEWRSSGSQYENLPRLAAELVRAKVDVIVAATPPGIKAAQQATATIPIVMMGVGDVVALGFVASLARPGGNITGVSNLSTDLPFKQVELLRAALSKLSRLAALVNPNHPDYPNVSKNLRFAAEKAKLAMTFVPARTPEEIEGAFVAATRARVDALIVQPESTFILYRQRLAELAVKHRLPSMFPFREHVAAGGLMSYGVNLTEHYRRAAMYVDKILKGAKPADLPIEQPFKFELVVNLKTAQAIGIKIPQAMLVRADEVIR